MPKNTLVDLNVILDVLLERQGCQASQAVLELQHTRGYNLYISGHIVTTFAYLLERFKVPPAEIRHQIDWLLQTFTVVGTTDTILKAAARSKLTDYEDAVVEQAAVACQAPVIVTRNTGDFTVSIIPAITPESLLLRQL